MIKHLTAKTGARDGVILVTVLWVIALLALLAVAASLTFRGFAGVMAVERHRLQADGLLTAGLEVAGSILASADGAPILDVESTVALASGSVRLRLEDEGGRIDIGRAPAELLAALFRAAGAADPNAVAKQVVDWRQEGDAASPSAAQSGAQATPQSAAQSAAPQSAAQTAASQSAVQSADGNNPIVAFTDVRQLMQVPGMRPEWIVAITPLATVFGNPTVNPLTAPAQVIAALPGVNEAQLATFLAARRANPTDDTRLVGLLGGAQKFLKVAAPQAVSVRLSATLADGYTASAEAVIVCLKGDRQPYRVLLWKSSTTSQPLL